MSNIALVESQFEELTKKYPSFVLYWRDGYGFLEGELNIVDPENNIEETFRILIGIAERYPIELPIVWEMSGKVPRTFHHNGDYLCLGVETDLLFRFKNNPTLEFFVSEFVVGYFYSHCFFVKRKKMPFGERPHGIGGIYEYYKELFIVDDNRSVLKFLKLLQNDQAKYRSVLPCPCGSERKAEDCHGDLILQLFKEKIPRVFQGDLKWLRKYRKRGG